MQTPLQPPDEARRLESLHRLQILDTPREERFDRIVRLVASYFNVPIALVSLVDADRQWFKAAHGLEVRQTPRNVSFCGHAILGPSAFVVEDAVLDERFCDNPLVVGDPRVRFYAGQPLLAVDGSRVGTLCIIDHKSRSFSAREREALADLARIVENEINVSDLRLALEVNREQERRLAAIVDGALDCVISIDESGDVLEFNPAAERTFGYRREDVLGKSLAALIIPERLHSAHRQGMSRFLETGAGPVLGQRIEVPARRADGTEFPVEMAITPSRRARGHMFTAFLRDITERKRTLQSLSLQHGVAKALAEKPTLDEAAATVIQSICETNGWRVGELWLADRSEPRLHCRQAWHAADPALERFAASRSGLAFAMGEGIPGRVWSENQPLWIENLDEAAALRRREQAKAAGLHAALALPVRSGGLSLGAMLFFSREIAKPDEHQLAMLEALGSQFGQITERRADEARLRQLTAELDAIFNLNPDGFLAFDPDGVKRYANRGFARMFAIEPRALDGLDVHAIDEILRQRCDQARTYPPMAQAADGESAMLSVGSGKRLVLKRTVKALEGGAGGPIGKVAYFRDVTLEDEVDRMKSEFLATAAHELRTPMSSILGFTELLLKRDYDLATQRDLLETIHRQSSNLGKLINELLDLARIEARAGKDFRLEPRSLFPLVRETVKGLSVPGDRRKVEVKLPVRSPHVAVDADKFRQALLNVLSNAYKYSPGRGAIELEASERKQGTVRQVGIVVRDHGIGMTPDQCERIFERFYRADTTGAIPGTGLGMSVVKEIIELHGGAVDVESTLGIGTAVTLWLPRNEDSRAQDRIAGES